MMFSFIEQTCESLSGVTPGIEAFWRKAILWRLHEWRMLVVTSSTSDEEQEVSVIKIKK